MFLCPICKKELSKDGNALKCVQNHSFDIASSGYINLLNPGKMNNKKAGDSKEMIKARTIFFESSAYKKISDKLNEIVSNFNHNIIVDAGCGEGYYTHNLAKVYTLATVFGFDMSKFGCEHGAKVAKREGLSSLYYSVSNIFDLPLPNDSTDIIVNLFAPVANEEFLRVLKAKGHLIVASAGINHLNGLKRVLYDEVYPNEEKFLNFDGFELVGVENLKYNTTILGNDIVSALFTMTPYYHRTSQSDKEKLILVNELNTDIEVNFAIYKKL